MKLIALVEVHPLDGGTSFITARFLAGDSEFDMPLTPEQAELILNFSSPKEEEYPSEEEEESIAAEPIPSAQGFSPSQILKRNSVADFDEDTLVLKPNGYQSNFFEEGEEYDDDEL